MRISTTLLTASSLACMALLGGCKKRFDDPAPIETGSELTFAVTEDLQGSRVEYLAKLEFTKDGDELVAKVSTTNPNAKFGNGTLRFDLGGTDAADTFTLKTTTGATAYLGAVYLPAKDRRGGVNLKMGRVLKKRQFKKWMTWEVLQNTSSSAGSIFFDSEMGVLIGWNLTLGTISVVGELAEAK